MDADEIMRLMRLIAAEGHEQAYLPQTKAELEQRGIIGFAEMVLGAVPVMPYDESKAAAIAYVCTTIAPGQMLSLPDNATAPCAWGCGRTVQFRPWAPAAIPKVCLYCMSERKKDDN